MTPTTLKGTDQTSRGPVTCSAAMRPGASPSTSPSWWTSCASPIRLVVDPPLAARSGQPIRYIPKQTGNPRRAQRFAGSMDPGART
jgi:hypothetical protein